MTLSAVGRVRIFTTRACGYCVLAKRLLAARGIPCEEVDVTSDDAQRAWLVKATGMRTVPQVFIGDKSIGGYQELSAFDRSGRLGAMLQDSNVVAPGHGK